MEVDSLFSCMFPEDLELDYEDDENDLFSIPGDIIQESEEDSEQFLMSLQPVSDQKYALGDISQKSFDNTSGPNASSDLSYGFTNSGKAEIKRDSVSCDTYKNDSIIIDARIFLDSHEDKKENVNVLSSFSSNECKFESKKKKIEREKGVDYEKIEKSNPTVTCDSNRKQESSKLKTKRFKPSNSLKKRSLKEPSAIENIKLVKKENLHFIPPPTSPSVAKPDIKRNLDTENEKSKSPVHSAPEKRYKIDKAKVKVEPNFSHTDTEKDLESVVFKPTVKPSINGRGKKAESKQPLLKKQPVDCKSIVDTGKSKDKKTSSTNSALDRKNILAVKRESGSFLEKQQVDCKSIVDSEKPKAKKTSSTDYALDRKNILAVKRESGASFKLDPSVNLQPKLILTRAPDYMIYGIPICTEFKATTPKDGTLEKKPILLLNPTHLKARVVLKRLTDTDLRSPAVLLSRVKKEMDEKVSRQLRAKGLAKNKDFVHRYCCLCKDLRIDRSEISKKKFCDNCDFPLIYVCAKCNVKHYVTYDHLFRHFKICRGTGDTKPGSLESVFLHRCTDCTFATTISKMMVTHMKSKGHKADGEFDATKVICSSKVQVKSERSGKKDKRRKNKRSKDKRRKDKKSKDENREAKPKLHRSKYAKFIINLNKKSFADATERYCGKCQEVRSSKTRKTEESCQECKTPLHLRCLKCSKEYRNYDTMYRHLRGACSPNSFKCVRCDYTDSSWTSMQWHVLEQHIKPPKSSRKGGKKKKGRKQTFYCEICSFQTNWPWNVRRHLRLVHKK